MSAGALLGLIMVAAIIVFVAMTGGYKGREEPAPCTSADWKVYATSCNRWSPKPSHPVVIVPQKTGKK
jgi:hypothetical protein